MARNELGTRGEDAAAAYLERIGYTIIERNWRSKAGEIDIVALDEAAIVLVEVKTRSTERRGTPEDAVTPTKQRRLRRLANAYTAAAGLNECEVRFDVIAIRPIAEDRALLRHHRAAFAIP